MSQHHLEAAGASLAQGHICAPDSPWAPRICVREITEEAVGPNQGLMSRFWQVTGMGKGVSLLARLFANPRLFAIPQRTVDRCGVQSSRGHEENAELRKVGLPQMEVLVVHCIRALHLMWGCNSYRNEKECLQNITSSREERGPYSNVHRGPVWASNSPGVECERYCNPPFSPLPHFSHFIPIFFNSKKWEEKSSGGGWREMSSSSSSLSEFPVHF